MNLLLLSVGAILVALGIVLIYDARIITNKYFGFGDQNEAATGLKMFGFILVVIGGLLLYFYL
jgi:uncharacterized protein YjeT (DUF2065 family)